MKNDLVNEFEKELIKKGISRRDAIKLASLGSASFLMNPSEVQANTPLKASEVQAKVVIVGGGLSGVSTAARLANSLATPDITIIEPNMKSVSYQPGNTFLASGIYEKKDVIYNTEDFLPNDVKLIKDKAVEFFPEENYLNLSNGEKINYDYLVVAAGLVLDFSKIKMGFSFGS